MIHIYQEFRCKEEAGEFVTHQLQVFPVEGYCTRLTVCSPTAINPRWSVSGSRFKSCD